MRKNNNVLIEIEQKQYSFMVYRDSGSDDFAERRRNTKGTIFCAQSHLDEYNIYPTVPVPAVWVTESKLDFPTTLQLVRKLGFPARVIGDEETMFSDFRKLISDYGLQKDLELVQVRTEMVTAFRSPQYIPKSVRVRSLELCEKHFGPWSKMLRRHLILKETRQIELGSYDTSF